MHRCQVGHHSSHRIKALLGAPALGSGPIVGLMELPISCPPQGVDKRMRGLAAVRLRPKVLCGAGCFQENLIEDAEGQICIRKAMKAVPKCCRAKVNELIPH